MRLLRSIPAPARRGIQVLWWGCVVSAIALVSAGCGASSGRGMPGRGIMKFGEAASDVAIAPDGSVAAVGTDDSYRGTSPVRLRSSSGRASEIVPKLGNARMERVGFSPDGSRLIAVSQWGIWIADLQNGTVLRHVATPIQSAGSQSFYAGRSVGRPLWQKDGTVACISGSAFGDGPVTAAWWRSDDATFIKSQKILSSERGDLHLSSFTLAPDGTLGVALWTRVKRNKKTISYGYSGRIEIIELPSGRVRCVLESITPKGLGQPAMSADNSLIAAADDTGRGWVWNARRGDLLLSMSGLTAANTGYTGAFAAGGFGRGARLAFLPDGQRLVAARDDGSLLIYSLKSGLPMERLGHREGHIGKILAAPDGKRIYTATPQGAILEWDVPDAAS